MAKSDNLRKAKENKNDEFYTRLEDIESEISQHKDYVKQFNGKTVLCNCDDPEWSNFFVFFRNHFQQLKLKKLITTHFNSDGSPSYKIEWSGEMLNDDPINMITTPLKGNGDFRSEECIEILKEADIIVTNPPFSIAREDFIPLLYKYNKKFVIIGDLNWTAYKTIFPLFKENKIFFGYTSVKEFKTPSGEFQKFGNKNWYTNLDLDKSHEPLILTKNYKGNEEKYPKYYNYDAIDVNKVSDIPKDYYGKMGVPITLLSSFCPEQFEIVGIGGDVEKLYKHTVFEKDGKKRIGYFKDDEILWSVPYSVSERKIGNSLRLPDENGNPDKAPYNRIIIKRKKGEQKQ